MIIVAKGQFKPHRWCKEMKLYRHKRRVRQFPESICMVCMTARREHRAYRRGYMKGWRAGRKGVAA